MITRANWFTAPTQMIATKVEKLDDVATLGLAGMATDRGSKIALAVGAGVVSVGAVVGSKVVVMLGMGSFMYGFMRGFRKTIVEMRKEE